MTSKAPGDGDSFTVVAVDTFGAIGIAVSLFDFFSVQKRFILQLDPLGVLIFLLGMALLISVRTTLGEYFTVRIKVTDGQTLIQSGLYNYIRHPLYLGLVLVFFSAPITWQSAYGALVALPIIPLLLRRIQKEEKVMMALFGDYAAYRKRTKKLIPLIY